MSSSIVISISSRGDLETLSQQALPHNHVASSIKSSSSRHGDLEILPHSGCDLETLPQQALPRNHVASSIKSSTSSGEDLETLAQQALQCNCVVTANIGNKDLETLILQALHMTSWPPPSPGEPPRAPWLKIITGGHRSPS
ncbi:hypothetical protein AAY473_037246 [Plecturocebus cupreus]